MDHLLLEQRACMWPMPFQMMDMTLNDWPRDLARDELVDRAGKVHIWR